MFVGRGRDTDGLDHSSCSAHAHLRLVFFPLLSTSRSGLYPHIPLVFLVGHCFFSTITCTAHSDRCNICHG